jgi:hypothetical protein
VDLLDLAPAVSFVGHDFLYINPDAPLTYLKNIPGDGNRSLACR